MSADNWTVCPFCQEKEGPTNDMLTFREDWEIGLIEGTTEVFIKYAGRCEKCGANAHHRTTIIVEIP